MKNRICVLGGMNMDITGAPHASLCPGDSNPGTVRMTPGGVGRNIAENLARMGFQVELVAPLGNDGFATLLRQACLQKSEDVSPDLQDLSLAPAGPPCALVRLRSGSDLAPVGAHLASSLKELRAGGDMGAMRQLLDEQAS